MVRNRTNKNERWNLENGRKRLDLVYFVPTAPFAQVPSCRGRETAIARALMVLRSATSVDLKYVGEGDTLLRGCSAQERVPSSEQHHRLLQEKPRTLQKAEKVRQPGKARGTWSDPAADPDLSRTLD